MRKELTAWPWLCVWVYSINQVQLLVSSIFIAVYIKLLVMLQMHESVVFHKRMYAVSP